MGFDFKALKRPSTFEQGPVVKKIVTTIPIRKPDKRDFFRVRPDEEDQKWTVPVFLLQARTGDYLVDNSALDEAAETGCLKAADIFYLVSYATLEPFLSWVAWPNPDGTDNDYNRSRREAFKLAENRWIKIRADQKNGFYETVEAVSEYPEPEWPEEPASLEKAVEIAFKDFFIDSPNHPVLKELRGEL